MACVSSNNSEAKRNSWGFPLLQTEITLDIGMDDSLPQENLDFESSCGQSRTLRTFAPIAAAHRYCARKFTRHHSRPQSHDPSDLRQGSRALAGPDFLSMCRVFVSYSQPIRFARFDGKSVNRGLPVLDKARALDPCRRSEGSWLWGRE